MNKIYLQVFFIFLFSSCIHSMEEGFDNKTETSKQQCFAYQEAIESFQKSPIFLVMPLTELPRDGILCAGERIAHPFSINGPLPSDKGLPENSSPNILIIRLLDFLDRVISLHPFQTLIAGNINLDGLCTIIVPSDTDIPPVLAHNGVCITQYQDNQNNKKRNRDRDSNVRAYIESHEGYPITCNFIYTDNEEPDKLPLNALAEAKINGSIINVNSLDMYYRPSFFEHILNLENYRNIPYTISCQSYKIRSVNAQFIPTYYGIGHLFAFTEAYREKNRKQAKYQSEHFIIWLGSLNHLDKKYRDDMTDILLSFLKILPKRKSQYLNFKFLKSSKSK